MGDKGRQATRKRAGKGVGLTSSFAGMSHSYATAIRDGLVSLSVAVEAEPTQVVGRWRVPPCSISSDALQPAPCSSMATGAAPVFSTSWASLW